MEALSDKTIIISPFSRLMRNGKRNPKNYPYWEGLVELLNKNNRTIQIGMLGEKEIGASEEYFNLSLKQIEKLIKQSDIWISVDNFLPHFCNHLNKRGIVIFGRSDPEIFGYKQNINILKDRKYLREYQFDIWEKIDFSRDCFLKPKELLERVYGKL